MHIDDFNYELPEGLIAQYPNESRDQSRLLVVHRETGQVEHKFFFDILDYLKSGDCLVLNNSKVIPARLFGEKEDTGAKIEILVLKRIENDIWEIMAKPAKKLKMGDWITFDDGRLRALVIGSTKDGTRKVEFQYNKELIFLDILQEIGKIPLPPYINRESTDEDKERYQTVYCENYGSVAAPTAGLHFTNELLEAAKEKGIRIAYVSLHVGVGTFKPVKCENIEEHKMHFEEYDIDEENAAIINRTKTEGGKIFCVGTTSARTLESAAMLNNSLDAENCNQFPVQGRNQYIVQEGCGNTDIFIRPGYKFKMTDSLITNFHLPKSTLLMLISAMYNRECILSLYSVAIERKYKFFSYGDAMIII